MSGAYSVSMGEIHDDGTIGPAFTADCPSLQCVLEVIEAALDAADKGSAWDLTIVLP